MLANTLASTGHFVTVIDIDARNASAILAAAPGQPEIKFVEGDGTSETALEAAKIGDADLFAALTGDDSTNGLAALKAKMTYRVMTVIATIWSGDLSSVFESMGVACVNPARLSTDTVVANIPQVLQTQPAGPARPSGLDAAPGPVGE